MSELRARLRALSTFPDELAVLDPAGVPSDPHELLLAWLDDAIASGERQPNAVAVVTLDEHGAPSSRTLIIKDIDEHGIHVSSSKTSRKAAHIAADPRAGLLCFWRLLGRQVEVTGPLLALDADTSARDWQERPNFDGCDNPDWQVWALRPERFEFLQATHDRNHVRVEYTRDPQDWTHRRLAASEASSHDPEG